MRVAAISLLLLMVRTTAFALEKPAFDLDACKPLQSQLASDGALDVFLSENVTRSFLTDGGSSVVGRTGGDAPVTGNVIVGFEIDKSGNPKYTTSCGGLMLLRPAAVSAVAKWKFRPYLINGQAVAVRAFVLVPVTLRPDEPR
ncbi:MAG: energy transducer TonB [Terracidiphilus sp.]